MACVCALMFDNKIYGFHWNVEVHHTSTTVENCHFNLLFMNMIRAAKALCLNLKRTQSRLKRMIMTMCGFFFCAEQISLCSTWSIVWPQPSNCTTCYRHCNQSIKYISYINFKQNYLSRVYLAIDNSREREGGGWKTENLTWFDVFALFAPN